MQGLTQRSFAAAVDELAVGDRDLARVVERCGPPVLLSRPRGFATLVYIIFEQQVSLASAKATFDRVAALMPVFNESAYLALSDEALKTAGVSRQKMRYTRLLARAILDRHLPLHLLGRKNDDQVRALLTAIPGIGIWTADVYLMLALRRPDLWPIGDLALVKALMSIKGFETRPDVSTLEALGERYRPYRSVATAILWRHYLHG